MREHGRLFYVYDYVYKFSCINTSISKRTDIVIVGKGAGPSKMQKIEELQAQGHNLRVIEEPELLSIMKEFNIEF